MPGGAEREQATIADVGAPAGPAPTPVVACPGLRVGPYTLQRLIGQGGMGSVWTATDGTGQLVAIKLVRADVASPDAVARFAREARLLVRLQHPAVARTLDAGVADGIPYIAMDLLVGRPLSEVVKREAPMPQDRALDLFSSACVGVAVAHAHDIVHRDVKPSNFFLVSASGPDGEERVCLLDFGIAKLFTPTAEGATLTQTDMALGTPGYVAPEQFRNAKQADRRADIWSLGLVLFRMLTGRSPFPAETNGEYFAKILAEAPLPLRALLPDAPEALERLIGTCLRKDPARRFADVRALSEALAPLAPLRSQTALDQIRALPAPPPLAMLGLPPVGALDLDLDAETQPTSNAQQEAAENSLPDLQRVHDEAFGAPSAPPSRRTRIALGALAAVLALAAGKAAITASPSPPPPAGAARTESTAIATATLSAPASAVPTQAPFEAPTVSAPPAVSAHREPALRTKPARPPQSHAAPAAPPVGPASATKLPWSRSVDDSP